MRPCMKATSIRKSGPVGERFPHLLAPQPAKLRIASVERLFKEEKHGRGSIQTLFI